MYKCDNCGWNFDNPKSLCSKCGKVRYCSSMCQREDWRYRHRKICNDLPYEGPRGLPGPIIPIYNRSLTVFEAYDKSVTFRDYKQDLVWYCGYEQQDIQARIDAGCILNPKCFTPEGCIGCKDKKLPRFLGNFW